MVSTDEAVVAGPVLAMVLVLVTVDNDSMEFALVIVETTELVVGDGVVAWGEEDDVVAVEPALEVSVLVVLALIVNCLRTKLLGCLGVSMSV